ncbi:MULTISPECIES: response regulator [Aminobacter]|jgi:two-component system phosphate regulon response regulator OmpR|uniref:Regulatory protein VirG n=2 Tax=Aminobacter TaxID=31988 RepID=A0AAC9ARK7_AMIAI|nr:MULTISPECIES: response regulator transcription factor [Aminobacter]AMS42164.1 Putative two component transcriptional regulator [Aminobacter aminovorans]MBA8906227.1 DNA-binding response OmpR family regulator [Aminobacter ciceronei]MBA9020006.1 DNA-binding response OmpR family regulator [Aminobacter ciceronei]MBB3706595.1 DNA-binding response OmpR family regulator [Aminobacter aminovorans]MRX31746.1 response regulator [Aminobacter sp. MDW-2]
MAEQVLIIDDDTRLSAMIADYLSGNGYIVHTAATGHAGLADVQRRSPDAVILDVMLPDLDGFEACRRMRAVSDVAILMLTAKGDETDRIIGLELGADDYLPKPFNPRELLARLKAILRRRRGGDLTASRILRSGRLEIDPGSRSVRIDGRDCPMTSYQFDLLVALAENAGRVLSREQLMDLVKGEELEAFDRSIDVHISRIRAAIEDSPKHPRRIVTVRGAGYVFARFQDDQK